jgi:hypothetical protein
VNQLTAIFSLRPNCPNDAMNRVARIAGHVQSSMGEQESFLGILDDLG